MGLVQARRSRTASTNTREKDEAVSKSLETMEMYFEVVEKAAETWKIVQQIPNYEGVVGELLFKQ